jgi:hypothetical protein
MDVYHRVLVKLFEETGGSDSKAVDFADLVKRMKFHANYVSIFKELSVQGWIVETGKVDWVRLTHWGIEEAKKSQTDGAGGNLETKKDFNRLLSEARELVGLVETLSNDGTKDNFSSVEKKNSQINAIIAEIKSKF